MRKFRIFDSENSYEYDVIVTGVDSGTKYELFRSTNSAWTEPILSVVDDGNGIKFSEKIGKRLEYHFMVELRLISNFIS